MSPEFRLDAPVGGQVYPISTVPDQAFADGMLGPGIAIYPDASSRITVSAPAAGLIRTIHPHAFVLQICPKLAALVHLGIDTYRADRDQFSMLSEQGRYVSRLDPIIDWDISRTVAADFAPWVVVTILGFDQRAMRLKELAGDGTVVSPGQELLELDIDSE